MSCLAVGTRPRSLVCAIDGTIMAVPDIPATLDPVPQQCGGRCGGGSYPTPWLLTVLADGLSNTGIAARLHVGYRPASRCRRRTRSIACAQLVTPSLVRMLEM